MNGKQQSRYLTQHQWISILKAATEKGGRIFPVATLKALSGLKHASLLKALQRLHGKRLLCRVGPGFFMSPLFPATLEEIAMVVAHPCYISFESALSRYGILSQTPMVLTCATTRPPRRITTLAGDIFLRHITPKRFWGFQAERGVLWAEPEKALLDWCYWKRKTEGHSPALDEFDLEELNIKKLQVYAKKYPKPIGNILIAPH